MPKFNVGDEVVGNTLANEHYSITVEGWKGIVTDICGMGRIIVDDFPVLAKCFDLITPLNLENE